MNAGSITEDDENKMVLIIREKPIGPQRVITQIKTVIGDSL
jgi:hypothetical protein